MNITQIYKECATMLSQNEIENPNSEAQYLIEKVFGLDRVHLIACGNTEADSEKIESIKQLTERRINREPLQYILGSWSFMGFDFKVGEGVLIPRDDTEVVVNLCLDFLNGRQSKKTADLCSGSGAIAVSLSNISGADVTAVELDKKAYSYLEQNIKLNNSSAKAVRGDVLNCADNFADGEFDLIVANPPYIMSSELTLLQAEVQKEPAIAFDGGKDGCDFYRAITCNWSRKLKKGGALAFELGEGQADTVTALMKENGFGNFKLSFDFGGTQRAIIGTLL